MDIKLQETARLTEDNGNVRVYVRASTDSGVTWPYGVWVDATAWDSGAAGKKSSILPYWNAVQAKSTPVATTSVKGAITVTV